MKYWKSAKSSVRLSHKSAESELILHADEFVDFRPLEVLGLCASWHTALPLIAGWAYVFLAFT